MNLRPRQSAEVRCGTAVARLDEAAVLEAVQASAHGALGLCCRDIARILHGVRLAFPDPPLSVGGIALRPPEPSDIPWITAACSDR